LLDGWESSYTEEQVALINEFYRAPLQDYCSNSVGESYVEDMGELSALNCTCVDDCSTNNPTGENNCVDDCGVCQNGNDPEDWNSSQDCAGNCPIVNGEANPNFGAYVNDCGNCIPNNQIQSDCVEGCDGNWYDESQDNIIAPQFDACSNCGGQCVECVETNDNYDADQDTTVCPSDDFLQNSPNGEPYDSFVVCGEWPIPPNFTAPDHTTVLADCNGVCGGTASTNTVLPADENACYGVCMGGDTGKSCGEDCHNVKYVVDTNLDNQDENALHMLDFCEVCVKKSVTLGCEDYPKSASVVENLHNLVVYGNEDLCYKWNTYPNSNEIDVQGCYDCSRTLVVDENFADFDDCYICTGTCDEYDVDSCDYLDCNGECNEFTKKYEEEQEDGNTDYGEAEANVCGYCIGGLNPGETDPTQGDDGCGCNKPAPQTYYNDGGDGDGVGCADDSALICADFNYDASIYDCDYCQNVEGFELEECEDILNCVTHYSALSTEENPTDYNPAFWVLTSESPDGPNNACECAADYFDINGACCLQTLDPNNLDVLNITNAAGEQTIIGAVDNCNVCRQFFDECFSIGIYAGFESAVCGAHNNEVTCDYVGGIWDGSQCIIQATDSIDAADPGTQQNAIDTCTATCLINFDASKDCNGECNGLAFINDCGICVGGTTDFIYTELDITYNGNINNDSSTWGTEITQTYQYGQDCAGICLNAEGNQGNCVEEHLDNGYSGEYISGLCGFGDCGICGGEEVIEDCTCMDTDGTCEDFEECQYIDCNGICFGEAFINDCGICVGGDTDRDIFVYYQSGTNQQSQGKDCYGVCFGSNIVDDCGNCTCSGSCLDDVSLCQSDIADYYEYPTTSCGDNTSESNAIGTYDNNWTDGSKDCYGTCLPTSFLYLNSELACSANNGTIDGDSCVELSNYDNRAQCCYLSRIDDCGICVIDNDGGYPDLYLSYTDAAGVQILLNYNYELLADGEELVNGIMMYDDADSDNIGCEDTGVKVCFPDDDGILTHTGFPSENT
jgi:hypothetical protein